MPGSRAAPSRFRLCPAATASAAALAILATTVPAQAATAPAVASSAPASPAAVASAPLAQLPTVTVNSGAVEGFRTPPSHSYEVGGHTLRQQPATSFPDALAQHLPGVALTHEQGNPLQPTLHFDGFAASPLLGTPQGLSVFQDGVRINEPFGDTVNWDLVPTNAIRSINLVPFADPVYGLNTLGGAVLLRTLDGRSAPGGSIGIEAGSFGRTAEDARFGSAAGDWTYFVAARNQHENGYTPFTASSNRTLFAKATRDADGNHLDLSYTFAQSHLAGAQTLPREWMNTPTAIYSAPDWFDNQLNFLNLGDTQRLTPHWQVTGRLYLRNSDQSGLNSNVNNNYDGATPTLDNPVADNVINGLHQQARGITLAARNDAPIAGMANVATVGVDDERQTVDFTQAQQAATFTPARYTLGIGPFDQAPVNLGVHNVDRGLYFTERLSPTHWIDVTAGGRYESVHIDMNDRLGGALGGSHHYSRFNPSVGVDLHPTPRTAYYLRYAQGMRVPMPVELTCASPTAPCTLPNVLVADPELQPVIAHTWQGGAVWRLGGLRIHAAYTRTQLDNALQFISLSNMTQGYFTNIPKELFRTATLDVTGATDRWLWTVSVSHTLATYESAFLEPSTSNSTADASGNIHVSPGDRLPDIPAWTATLSAQFTPNERWLLRGDVVAYSDRYAQGDENNQDVRGTVPGYAVVNLAARYRLDRHWRLDLSVHNLFNRVYADFGQLGSNEFTGAGRSFSSNPSAWQNTQFVAPGAPRGIWLGVHYAWD